MTQDRRVQSRVLPNHKVDSVMYHLQAVSVRMGRSAGITEQFPGEVLRQHVESPFTKPGSGIFESPRKEKLSKQHLLVTRK
jgi:hypothetical protein